MSKKKFDRVYQFKITLKRIKPLIWRRIQVPETDTFLDLHNAIQDAMGWEDYHLHMFKLGDIEIGEPHEDYESEVIPEKKEKIADYFSIKTEANYTYDFGDNWEHKVVLEKILPREKDVSYPITIDGKRACPPEDCGGIWGYEEFLEAIKDPKHPEHKEMLEWIGGEFDPEAFEPDET